MIDGNVLQAHGMVVVDSARFRALDGPIASAKGNDGSVLVEMALGFRMLITVDTMVAENKRNDKARESLMWASESSILLLQRPESCNDASYLIFRYIGT